MTVYAFDKDGFAPAGRWELPGGFVFHFGNAWEDSEGTIRFDMARYPDDAFLLDTAKAYMRGENGRADSVLAGVTLRPGGSADLQLTDQSAEFPQIDRRFVGGRHAHVWSVGGETPDRPGARTTCSTKGSP